MTADLLRTIVSQRPFRPCRLVLTGGLRKSRCQARARSQSAMLIRWRCSRGTVTSTSSTLPT